MTIKPTRRGVLAGIASAPLLTIPAAASEDAEFLALYEECRRAHAEMDTAQDAYDAAQEVWFASPERKRLPVPAVTVCGYTCIGEANIEKLARDDVERDAALAEYRRMEAAYEAASAMYGVPQATAVRDAAEERYWKLFEELAAHPVSTAEGVRIKLDLLAESLRIGEMDEHIILADTALAGADRLASGGAS